jgi:hypothetical protein
MSEFVNCSLNLVDSALNHLQFIEFIDTRLIYYSEGVSLKAAYRYEKFWLPFYHSFISSGENPGDFFPPNDIAWIWHCHLLAPTKYKEDCENLYGQVLDHFCFSVN